MMEKQISPLGKKFFADGTPREFPGNTVICHIPCHSSQIQHLLQARSTLANWYGSSKFSFLPASSYHMTVFEGVCDQDRLPGRWTSHKPLNAPLEVVDRLMSEKWLAILKPHSLEMRFSRMKFNLTLGLTLEPATQQDASALKQFREDCSVVFGIRQENHDTYRFHITLAYLVKSLNPVECWVMHLVSLWLEDRLKKSFGVLRLGEPELTFFQDMTHFAPTRSQARVQVKE